MGNPARVCVIGSEISACDMEAAVDCVATSLESGTGGYVCFTNVHATVLGRQDPQFKAITNGSFLSVADGKPVYWVAAALKGNRDIGHVPGPDFFIEVMKRLPARRHFLYGSTPEVLEKLSERLRALVPGLQICGSISPPFRQLTSEDMRHHYAAIRHAEAEIVWVGLGAPKQEKWMAQAWEHLKPCVVLGVGAAFDFYAGTVRRAPSIFGKLGLEWAFRLWQEPRRLWRRYLVTNSLFIGYVMKDMIFRYKGH